MSQSMRASVPHCRITFRSRSAIHFPADETDDLVLGRLRQRVPHLGCTQTRTNDRLRARERESNAVGMHTEAAKAKTETFRTNRLEVTNVIPDKASHGNAAMLDLRVAEPPG